MKGKEIGQVAVNATDVFTVFSAHKKAPFCIINPDGCCLKSTGTTAPGTVEANATNASSLSAEDPMVVLPLYAPL